MTNTLTDERGLADALATIQNLLTTGESVEAWATQRRIFAMKQRRIVLVATTGRFIALTRHLIGGYDSADIRWQDLKEVRIRAGIFGADLTVVAQTSADLNIAAEGQRVALYAGLRKAQAQDLYRICQQHDQAWREKRRVRELEELRAKSGGIQLGGAGTGAAAADGDAARRLREAHDMLTAKLITDSEFENIKARIIAGL